MNDNTRIAILGGGHGAFAHAADLSIKGLEVNLFEIPEMAETIAEVKRRGGIESEPDPSTGLKGGFGKLHKVTSDAGEAFDGVDVVFVVVPAFAQEAFAKAIAPHVKEDQVIVLSPGNFGGAIVFARVLRQHGCKPLPVLCEAQSMIYACRKSGPASVKIHGFKEGMGVAAFPSRLTGKAMSVLQKIYPKLKAAESVLWTGLSNPNPISHPTITILNAGRIEGTSGDFLFYVEGVTPAVRRVFDTLDKERMAVGAELGLKLVPNREMTKRWYRHQSVGEEMHDTSKLGVYQSIRAQKELDNRYLTEDVPYGLVPLEDMGKLVGVDTPICRSLIDLSNSLLGVDFRQTGRTLRNIGLGGMSVFQIQRLVEEGEI
ncbi:MAG: NADP transhydrogenase subunit alpha [Anaerolineales bacterium]|nr:MAG: NADP transhydrogenase subunit alpha [Anaerolineales bacterium]